MFTSSAISRMVKRRSLRTFSRTWATVCSLRPLKVGLDADRLSRILDPL
jgi:hypothetical protein